MDRDRVLPDWLIVGTIVACLAGIVGLIGITINELRSDDDRTPSAAATTGEKTPKATEPSPTEPEETTATVERTLTVSVYNQTQVTGLARNTLAKAVSLGWPQGVSGNWQGAVPANTVYYPAGGEEQAELLAEDLGITRVVANSEGITSSGLTVIMAGPQ